MKTLSKNEWVAIVVSVFVVGFFFVFGQALISLFTGDKSNSSKKMQNQGLIVNDTVVGTGDTAQTGDRVIVHYTGKFTNGDVFDSSLSRGEPLQFVLGSGMVIKGWDEGLVGMKVGGKRTLTIPPELGYGMKNVGPIPAGSTLIFDVELLKVEKPQQ